MSMEVYWASGSAPAWRVLLALAAKGLPYESKLLELSKNEHKTPEHLARNPRGTVPTIVDDGMALYESLAILAYLERKYPEPPLFGTTPEEHGQIWRLVAELDGYLEGVCRKIIRPLFFGRAKELAEQIRESIPRAHDELARLETLLQAHDYLCGARISAADIVAFPVIAQLERASLKDAAKDFDLGFVPWTEHYPGIAAWIARIEAMPGYDATYPPHWRNS